MSDGQYTDEQLTADIAATGKTAPRITPDGIDGKIVEERFWQPEGTTLTVCALTLENGFVVVGHSAAASPENFDAEIGRKLARDKAREHIWPLEGYLLREKLHIEEHFPLRSVSLGDEGTGVTSFEHSGDCADTEHPQGYGPQD